MKPLPLHPPRARPEEPEHPFHGSLVFQGIVVDVENRAGSVRSGTDPDGRAWSVTLPWHYGEIRGTTASDGDAVDAFIGPDRFATHAWVVQQKRPGTMVFDEPKVMLGFARREDAVRAFRAAYTSPGFILGITRWPMAALFEALEHSDLQGGRLGPRALQRTLRKGGRGRVCVAILKKAAEQLGMFGTEEAPKKKKTRIHVRAHVRQTVHGAVVVTPHEQLRLTRELSGRDIPGYTGGEEVKVSDPTPATDPAPAMTRPGMKFTPHKPGGDGEADRQARG